jgi:translation initiation factor 1A
MREKDMVIIQPWDFQDDKCDVLYRYTHIQAQNMLKRGLVPKTLESFI